MLNTLSVLTTATGISATASEKINESIIAIGGFATWFVVIVVIIAAAIIIGLVINSFGGNKGM